MVVKTFEHELSDGSKAKFTIQDKIQNGGMVFFANVIGLNLESYKILTEEEKKLEIGMQITDGKGNRIYYFDAEKLESDIKSKYGNEWLESE